MTHWLGDVIDLTNSFTLVDHCALSNAVIDLDTDDSFIDSSERNSQHINDHDHHQDTLVTVPKIKKSTVRRKTSIVKKSKQASDTEGIQEKQSSQFGDCPICWDDLGKNPLASTKCGHVFCLKCLERCLHVDKKCPTCRKVLKGSSAYHPLYLSRG